MNVANVVLGQGLREIGEEHERRGGRRYLCAVSDRHSTASAVWRRLVPQERFERLINLSRRNTFVPYILNLENLVEALPNSLAR